MLRCSSPNGGAGSRFRVKVLGAVQSVEAALVLPSAYARSLSVKAKPPPDEPVANQTYGIYVRRILSSRVIGGAHPSAHENDRMRVCQVSCGGCLRPLEQRCGPGVTL